jgi:hypothetical protein
MPRALALTKGANWVGRPAGRSSRAESRNDCSPVSLLSRGAPWPGGPERARGWRAHCYFIQPAAPLVSEFRPHCGREAHSTAAAPSRTLCRSSLEGASRSGGGAPVCGRHTTICKSHDKRASSANKARARQIERAPERPRAPLAPLT